MRSAKTPQNAGPELAIRASRAIASGRAAVVTSHSVKCVVACLSRSGSFCLEAEQPINFRAGLLKKDIPKGGTGANGCRSSRLLQALRAKALTKADRQPGVSMLC